MKKLNLILMTSLIILLATPLSVFSAESSPEVTLSNITQEIPDNWWDGGWDKLSELQSFISKYPDKPALCAKAQYYIGCYYQSVGNYDAAMGAYETVISTYSDAQIECTKAQYETAQIYFYCLSDFNMAIKEYQKIISNYSDNSLKPVVQLMTGRAYLNLDNYTLAEASFKKVIDEYPEATYQQYEAYVELGNLLMRQSTDLPDSKQKITQAISYYKKAYLLSEPGSLIGVIDSIYKSLRKLDMSMVRANQFIKYQKYGPQGEDGISGTPDDLTDPLVEF